MSRVSELAASEFADSALRNAEMIGKLGLLPPAPLQRLDDRFPVHLPESIASAIALQHRRGDYLRFAAAHHSCVKSIDAIAAGQRLTKARERAGFESQSALARAAEVSQPTIWAFEAGRNPNMSAPLLAAVCQACGITVEYVLYGTGQESSPYAAQAASLLQDAPEEQAALAVKALRGMFGGTEPTEHGADVAKLSDAMRAMGASAHDFLAMLQMIRSAAATATKRGAAPSRQPTRARPAAKKTQRGTHPHGT